MRMEARDGVHTESVTKARLNVRPRSPSSDFTRGMCARSAAAMSSVTTRTMFGCTGEGGAGTPVLGTRAQPTPVRTSARA